MELFGVGRQYHPEAGHATEGHDRLKRPNGVAPIHSTGRARKPQHAEDLHARQYYDGHKRKDPEISAKHSPTRRQHPSPQRGGNTPPPQYRL